MIYDVSDEDNNVAENVAEVIIPEPAQSVLSSLVADYNDGTDDGRYFVNKQTHSCVFHFYNNKNLRSH